MVTDDLESEKTPQVKHLPVAFIAASKIFI